MLGVGIFVAPAEVAAHARTPGAFMLVWAAGGLAALCGAVCVAELGAMLPRSGGHYVYIREAYGPGAAFAAGWLQLVAIFPGSVAALAAAVASLQLPALLGGSLAAPLPVLGLQIPATFVVGSVVILGFTTLNHFGIVPSARIEMILVGVPICFLALSTLLVLSGLAAGPSAAESPPVPLREVDRSALAAAYLPVYFAYSGWDAALYVAGEVEAPAVTLPRSLVGGTIVVTALYLLLCAGFLAVLPLDRLAHVGEAGAAVAQQVFGGAGVVAMTSLVVFATLASLNGTVLTGSRISQAMARNRDFFSFAAHVDSRTGTPTRGLWLQSAIALVLLATQRFDQLLAYTTSAMLITGTLSVAAVVVLRRTRPELARPYRASLYPLTPALYACGNVVVLVLLARRGDPSVLMAVAWFVGAFAIHRLFLAPRRSRRP
jgi:APA family basic amino acid/polyamine antiporter